MRQSLCSSSQGTVRLVNAVFYAHHGVHQEEHKIGGRYEVDVEMSFDFAPAAQSDQLQDTVDYAAVYRLIQEQVTGHRFYLIERLAYQIAQQLLQAFGRLEEVVVTVRKHNPPVGGTCDRAEAVYGCSRKRM